MSTEEAFCKQYPGYGYDGSIEELRRTQFPQLHSGEEKLIYLDHGGATLHTREQIERASSLLVGTLFANPHSQSSASQKTHDLVERARERVLEYFHTDPSHYSVVFTSGATSALKLVGETLPWSASSRLLYTMDNHTSAVGIREFALAKGARVTVLDSFNNSFTALPTEFDALPTTGPDLDNHTMRPDADSKTPSEVARPSEKEAPFDLYVFPLESNFSGARVPPTRINDLQAGKLPPEGEGRRRLVMVDCAKASGTGGVDLTKHPADFVTISFYKIFGYPTGLGALLVRNDAAPVLKKAYFGGGTVEAIASDAHFHASRQSPSDLFEDGTISFQGIATLQFGFDVIQRLGTAAIRRHMASLTHYIHSQMDSLRHYNGQRVCVIYGNHHLVTRDSIESDDSATYRQGAVIAFNVFRVDGRFVGYTEVERFATTCNIQLRVGCFCNGGACQHYLKLSADDVKRNLEAGHVCWDDNDLIDGRPTGAVRISLGYMTDYADVQAWLRFLEQYFVTKDPTDIPTHLASTLQLSGAESGAAAVVESISVFPIKSCRAQTVDTWPLGNHGLLFDREWVVVSASGVALSQKRVPRLCLITPIIDLHQRTLTITAPGMSPLTLPLDYFPTDDQNRDLKVCGSKAGGLVYGENVREWFSTFLGRSANLARRPRGGSRASIERTILKPSASLIATGQNNEEKEKASTAAPRIAFANEAQFLFVSSSSARQILSEGVLPADATNAFIDRFRPNIVVGGGAPFDEDTWDRVVIAEREFEAVGPCVRCSMINVNQESASTEINLYKALAPTRRKEGKVVFGMLMSLIEHSDAEVETTIKVGQPLSITHQ